MIKHASSCKLMQTCMPIKISFGEVGASSSATAWGGVGGVFGICEATEVPAAWPQVEEALVDFEATQTN